MKKSVGKLLSNFSRELHHEKLHESLKMEHACVLNQVHLHVWFQTSNEDALWLWGFSKA